MGCASASAFLLSLFPFPSPSCPGDPGKLRNPLYWWADSLPRRLKERHWLSSTCWCIFFVWGQIWVGLCSCCQEPRVNKPWRPFIINPWTRHPWQWWEDQPRGREGGAGGMGVVGGQLLGNSKKWEGWPSRQCRVDLHAGWSDEARLSLNSWRNRGDDLESGGQASTLETGHWAQTSSVSY